MCSLFSVLLQLQDVGLCEGWKGIDRMGSPCSCFAAGAAVPQATPGGSCRCKAVEAGATVLKMPNCRRAQGNHSGPPPDALGSDA